MTQTKPLASGFPVDAVIENLRRQLAEKDAEILKLNQMYPATAYTVKIEKQLTASQLREQQLKGAYVLLENFAQSVGGSSSFWEDMNDKLEPASVIANFWPSDTSALEALIRKAGEVMLERCVYAADNPMWETEDSIRAIPGVTLDDVISTAR